MTRIEPSSSPPSSIHIEHHKQKTNLPNNKNYENTRVPKHLVSVGNVRYTQVIIERFPEAVITT